MDTDENETKSKVQQGRHYHKANISRRYAMASHTNAL